MHHDVALALRIRDVNSALCNTLDASVREVGDAVVRHEAAATGAMSAAALLGDVTRRIEELMRIVAGAEPATGSSPADAATAADIGSAIGAPAPPALGRMFSARRSAIDCGGRWLAEGVVSQGEVSAHAIPERVISEDVMTDRVASGGVMSRRV